MNSIKFTRTRNVKAPNRGTTEAAGIDFFIPFLDAEFVKDLILKNPNADVLYKIDLVTNGLETAYFIKNDDLAKLLEVGDVIRYSLDSHSQIEEIKTVYKHNGKVLNDPEISDVSPTYGNFDSKYRVALGTVCRKIDDYMTVEIDGSVETMKIASKTHIYIVENTSGSSGSNNIRAGKSDDIFDSLSKPSKVLVRTRYGDLSEVIIFKGEE